MPRSLITPVFVLLSFFPAAQAQEPEKSELHPCGTVGGASAWLREYQASPFALDRSEDTLWVAVRPHLLAKDNGSGRIAFDKFLNAFCQLNADFAEAKIRFYLLDGWNLINRTEYHDHATIPKGIEMMLENNAPNALNAYFGANVAGNCGYNLPYAGVAIAHGCANASDHTWAHEVGHALMLPHPFIGWEGKQYSFAVPTPTSLTYDYTYFHDTIDTQVPAPLDTALVELVNGSNCAIAADRICDTPPDYLSYRWDYNSQGLSNVKQKDPNGEEFYSDGSLFMSYAADNCSKRFSTEEINVMRAALHTQRASWVAPQMLQQALGHMPQPLEPVQDQIVPAQGALFRWSPTPNATHYLVQASRFTNFSFKQVDVVTTDTFLFAGQLSPNIKYYWRIRPFNYWHACYPYTELATFKTSAINASPEPDSDGWRFYPSLLSKGNYLHIEWPESWAGNEAIARIFNAAGGLIWETSLTVPEGRNSLPLPSTHWPAGVYRLVISSGKGIKQGNFVLG